MESAILVLRHEVTVLPLRMQVEGSPDKASAVTALGTLQNLAAESAANKDAIREAGGVPILINILETAPDTPVRYFLPYSTIPPCIISYNTLRCFTARCANSWHQFLSASHTQSVFMGELQSCVACRCIEVNMVVATQIFAASTDQILLGFVGFGLSAELCARTAVQSNIANIG